MELVASPLTQTAFVPFGEVMEVAAMTEGKVINYGNTEKFEDVGNIDVFEAGGRLSVNIYRSRLVALPFTVRIMERHPMSSQAFMPLSPSPFLVVVAEPGPFDPTTMRAFVAAPGQGINYRRGVWHHYSLALGACSDFFVLERAGPGDNCDEVEVAEPCVVRIVA